MGLPFAGLRLRSTRRTVAEIITTITAEHIATTIIVTLFSDWELDFSSRDGFPAAGKLETVKTK